MHSSGAFILALFYVSILFVFPLHQIVRADNMFELLLNKILVMGQRPSCAFFPRPSSVCAVALQHAHQLGQLSVLLQDSKEMQLNLYSHILPGIPNIPVSWGTSLSSL